MPKRLPKRDDLDDLIEPVCTLAALKAERDEPELLHLIEAAKAVKARYGFAVHTFKL